MEVARWTAVRWQGIHISSQRPQPNETALPGDVRLPYLPALDGLRALAVIGVLLYHAGLILQGGFLGVESFFVLSGFLVSGLLLAEWRRHGTIDIGSFWIRRARRLLPALVLVLAATLALSVILLPSELAALGGDMLAALLYVMNWHLVASQQSYFDPAIRAPLFQHLWSLAIEEQFYLLWPLLFGVGIRFLRPRGLLIVIVAAATASVISMAALYEPGSDPSRIYYGTDTRASGLLIGAALAILWLPGRLPGAASRRAGRICDGLGLAALAGLGWAYLQLFDTHPLLYPVGFLAVSLGTAALIATATHPQARLLQQLLGWKPICWIGVRSYGIYLWHWPIFELTRPGIDVPLSGWPLLALRLFIVIGLAALSYHFIEQPIRSGVLGRWLHRRRELRKDQQRMAETRRAGRAAVAQLLRPLLAFSVIGLVVSSAACTAPGTSQSSLGVTPVAVAAPTPTVATLDTPTATLLPTMSATPLATSSPIPSATPSPSITVVPPSPTQPALNPALAANLQEVLNATVADGYIPGAVVSVFVPGYEPWLGASGVADRAQQIPMTPDTRFRIASISKIFTAVVVLQLVDEGKIALDAPVDTWLPGLVPRGNQITVRNLLQHTSGLYDYLEDRSFVSRAYSEPERSWDPVELVSYAARFPAAFAPGAEGRWDYSSTNYVILGMIVEKATGNTLASEMRQRIFNPLQLDNTHFTPYEDAGEPMAHGYGRSTDQSAVSMSFAFATANIVSTTKDLQGFARALFGGELLAPETMALLQQFVNGKGQYNMPALAYGLGLMRNELPVGPDADGQKRAPELVTVLGHIGGFGGFRSALWYNPATGVIIALGVNQASTDPNLLATRVYKTVLEGLDQ